MRDGVRWTRWGVSDMGSAPDELVLVGVVQRHEDVDVFADATVEALHVDEHVEAGRLRQLLLRARLEQRKDREETWRTNEERKRREETWSANEERKRREKTWSANMHL